MRYDQPDLAYSIHKRGSTHSRKRPPSRLTVKTDKEINPPGANTNQGAQSHFYRAPWSIFPHDAVDWLNAQAQIAQPRLDENRNGYAQSSLHDDPRNSVG